MGTFSKTFASLGGFVAGEAKVIDYIKHHAPALIFSASPTPSSVAAALAALNVLEEEPERVERLISNSQMIRDGLTDAGFNIIDGRTGIVPVIVGSDELAFGMWKRLYDEGVFVNASLSETFGLTLIEAAATGVPVVATKDGGPRDIIANCKNGINVDVSDSKNISEALNRILDNQKLWTKYSDNGIENVKKFYSWNAHTEKYLYEAAKILKSRPNVQNSFAETGKKLLDMEKLIVTDIDYTLLGDDRSLAKFKNTLRKMSKQIGFGIICSNIFIHYPSCNQLHFFHFRICA